MKPGTRLILAALASGLRPAAAAGADAAAEADMSPITQVVMILGGLQGLCEESLREETSMFMKFKCWAQTIVSSKTASNEKATARADSLEQYLADLEAGRFELTTERVDLEKEISGLTADLDNAKAMRDREHEDFLAAKDETQQALGALDDAIAVLEEAAEGASSLLTVAGSTRSGHRLEAQAADYEKLSRAVEFGRRFLSHGDAVFLERVLTGDVPVWDWKKLNRKAEFKMSYKARSGKIVNVLKNLKFTFSTSLKDMEDKEEKAGETYDTLKEAKGEQKAKAEESLSKMELEGAARGLSKSEAKQEIEDLRAQVTADEKFIEQAKRELEDKDVEWAARKKLRMDEIKAISEAIAVLHSDDSRDLFKRSLSSQGYVQVAAHGYMFLEEKQSRSRGARLLGSAQQSASALLVRAARAADGDERLMRLADAIAAANETGNFTDPESKYGTVINMVDEIITMLQEEEKTDLDTKESCESARMEDTKESVDLSRGIDDLTDTMSSLNAKIAELEVQIEEKNEEVEKTKEELEEATKVREEEKAEHVKSDKDDKDASATIDQAIGVLEAFYKQNMFIQKRRQPVIVAGEAPPPPPKTWDEPYGGRDKESRGILAILGMLRDDIDADRAKAQKAEDKAEAAYQEFKTGCGDRITALSETVTDLTGRKGEKEQDVETANGERTGKKDDLAVVLQKIKDLQPGCDYMLVNFVVRNANRKIEIDGLVTAKAILQGANFNEVDETRELKPGDALLQRT